MRRHPVIRDRTQKTITRKTDSILTPLPKTSEQLVPGAIGKSSLFSHATTVAQEMWWRWIRTGNGDDPERYIHIVKRYERTTPRAVCCAIRAVFTKWDTLRSHFDFDGRMLSVHFGEPNELNIELDDVSDMREQPADEAAKVLIDNFLLRSFPITGNRLAGAKVISLPSRAVIFVSVINHIIFDARSRYILLREIEQALAGDRDAGKKTPIQFQKIAAAERSLIQSHALDERFNYWRKWYHLQPELTAPHSGLPLIWQSGGRAGFRLQFRSTVLQKFDRIARSSDVTRFVIYLGVLSFAFYQWSGYRRFSIRSIGDQRSSGNTKDVIGLMMCADTVDVHVPRGPQISHVLKSIQASFYSSLRFRVPSTHLFPPYVVHPEDFESVGPNRIPLTVNYFSAPNVSSSVAPILYMRRDSDRTRRPEISQLPPERLKRPTAPVELQVSEGGDSLVMTLLLNNDLFDSAEQNRFLNVFISQMDQISEAAS